MSTTKDQLAAFRHAKYEVDELLTPGDDVHIRGDWWQVLIAIRGAARVAEQLAAYESVQVEQIEAAVYWCTYYVSRHARGYYGGRAVALRDTVMPVLMQHLPPDQLGAAASLARVALRDASLGNRIHAKVHYRPCPCRQSKRIVMTDDPALVTCGNCKQRMGG